MRPKCAGCPIGDAYLCRSYALLCDRLASNPEGYTPIVLRLNARKPDYVPMVVQAGNVMGAIGRIVADVATGQRVLVDPAEKVRRFEICRACDEFDPEKSRCRKCGCYSGFKARLASEHCPLDPPKW